MSLVQGRTPLGPFLCSGLVSLAPLRTLRRKSPSFTSFLCLYPLVPTIRKGSCLLELALWQEAVSHARLQASWDPGAETVITIQYLSWDR